MHGDRSTSLKVSVALSGWSFKLKIDKLTSEQEGRLPEFIEGRTKIVLRTDPADPPRAEAAVRYISTAVLACGCPQRS